MGWFNLNRPPKRSTERPKTAPKAAPQTSEDPTRRKFMIGVGGAVLAAEAAAAVAGGRYVATHGSKKEKEGKPKASTPEKTKTQEPRIERPQHIEYAKRGPYETGDLEGKPVADLFAFYLGVPEGTILPKELNSKFDDILDGLWQKKISYVGRKRSDWVENTQRACTVFVDPYQDACIKERVESKTLKSFRHTMQPVISDLHDAVDWEKFKTLPAFALLENSDVELVKDMAANIDAEVLMAYAVTELMPSVNDSKMNVDVFEFLSKNAGPQFLASIPALHDPYLSVGMFQFTSLALYEGADGARGASRINRLVKDHAHKIPGSVIALTTPESQIRAAYLFAVENLAQLVRTLRKDGNTKRRDKRLHTMKSKATKMHVGLLQYLASAHHSPKYAREGFIKWLDTEFEGSHAQHCNRVLAEYVRKSHGNYQELKSRL